MVRYFFSVILLFAAIVSFAQPGKKPKIVGQQPVVVTEDNSKTLTVSDLIIEYEDEGPGPGPGPEPELELDVEPGDSYIRSGTTITPADNFSGVLLVPVTVHKGPERSNRYTMEVQVTEENDAPVITGQVTLQTSEGQSITLTLNDLIVSDPDNAYPGDFTLTVYEGTSYTVSGATVTPDPGFAGTLSVDVSVNDGSSNSNSYPVQIEVSNVNDVPLITGQQLLAIDEDQSLVFQSGFITVSDDDDVYPSDFTIALSPGSDYSISESTIIPSTNFFGTLSVPVTVNDGVSDSGPYNLSITVNAVNDVPQITGQSALSTGEGEALTLEPGHLTVNDPDNTYPSDFTLSVSDGDNFSVSGTTITPDPGYSGPLTIPVTVSDLTSTSGTYSLQVSVDAVNDAPTITGQVALGTSEGQPITIELTHLTVTDPDNNYPEDFTLTVSAGDNYSLSGNTVTPTAGFSGTLSVPVTVRDLSSASNIFSLQISVDAVNDVPVITGQATVETNEDQPVIITLQQLTVTDADNVYPADFTLSVSPGSDYTVSGTTVTPSPGFNGTLSVGVTVSDGTATSDVFDLQIQVNSVNNAPVITGQTALQTNEEESLTLSLSNLTVSDADNTYPTGFTMTVYAGENYSFSGSTITPVADFNGTLSVPVTVNDGSASSEIFNVQITVLQSNDAPAITGQTVLTTPEDTPLAIGLSSLLVNDNDNSFPTGFTLNISGGENFTVSGTTVTPAANFTGTLSVPVTVSDGILLSSVFDLAVEVTPVNDPPLITAQAALSTKEETPIELQLADLTVTDPDNTYPNGFTLNVNAGTNYTVDGTSVIPATDFTGTLAVSLTVSDGLAPSEPYTVQINVEGENDAPSITAQSSLEINEEQSLTIALTHLTVIDSDNSYPQGFTLNVGEGSNYTVSGTAITPVENFNGTLSVPVIVNDGATNSNTFDLQVLVTAVNDVPVVAGQSEISVYRNKSFTLDFTHLNISDPDNSFPDQFTLTAYEGKNYTLFETTITPALDFTGVLSVPVTVSDGTAESETFLFQITIIAPPNVKPVIVSQVALTTYENESLVLQLSHLVVTDPDNRFPDDFTLNIFEGLNYTIDGNTIIPATDFAGQLTVPVTVSDPESVSDQYNVMIQVVPVADVPLITSQHFLRMNEDDSLVLKFSDLVVIDPDNTYPNGFSLTASSGNNYTLEGLEVKPSPNYNGYLSVPVTVNDGANNSAPYHLLILVEPINDEPLITEPEPGTLFFARGKGALKIFEQIVIEDVDDDSLSLAEITIDPSAYEAGKDSLIFETTPSIRAAFDRTEGLLVLFGRASVTEYLTVIQSIEYDYVSDTDPVKPSKNISLTVSDGKVFNRPFNRVIGFEDDLVSLDIPSGFTPNGDGANDTWNIKSIQGNDSFSGAVIRVYNKTGVLVFESTGLEREWDGRMNGSMLPADSYFYTIDMNGSYARSRYKGIVTILR